MVRCLIIFSLGIGLQLCTAIYDPSTPFLQVIISVLHYYHQGCLIIYSPSRDLRSELQLEEMMMFLKRQINEQQIQISVRHFGQTAEELRCRHQSPPLCVLLCDGNSVRRSLQARSLKKNLGGAAWLLFMNPYNDLEDFFTDIHIPINCKFLVAKSLGGVVTLTEVYRVTEHFPLQSSYYGSWSQSSGATFSSLDMYERRNNLQGLVFKGTGIAEPPITILRQDNGTLKIEGFFGAVWSLLEQRMNFTTKLVKALDNAYGSFDNGSWSGMIEMLKNKEVDVAISEFRMTKERIEVVDYTLPILFSKYQVFIRQPSTENTIWGNFLAPFTPKLWLIVAFSIAFIAILFLVAFHVNRRFIGPGVSQRQKLYLCDSLHIIFGAFCQQGQGFTPQSNSCRVIYFSAHLMGVVLIAAYSAALVSFLAKQNPVLPFNNLYELLQDGTYKFGLLQKSAEFNLFYQSNDTMLQKIYTRFIAPEKDTLPASSQEGLSRTCYSKYAFFLSTDIAHGKENLPCEVMALPGDSFGGSVSMALTKHSPYKKIINYNLLRLRLGGVIQRARRLLWTKKSPDVTQPWITVSIQNVIPLLAVLMAGLGISVVLLVIEWLFYVL